MALTKVTKSGITDNAVDADKIEDGTIVAADIATGTITNAKLAGSIANDKLANFAITVNGSSVSLGGSVSAGSIEWQTVKTSGFTAVAGEGYFCNTNGGAFTATLPASPSAGDTVAFKDYGDDFATNALTIARNGENIQGVANDSEITTDRASIVCVFIDDTKGWLFTNESNVADLQLPLFTTATGGTIATSGNFKVHSFTGDGCFVVSQLGNSPAVPAGGPINVDYLVVAGGGGGEAQGGGGGAGGHRTTFPSPGCNAGAFPISSTTYPITVGAGGNAGSTGGSNSVFSTITSAGGGSAETSGDKNGYAGGSGGGGSASVPGSPTGSGGAGNTPPVSPPQGNNGGNAGGSLLAGGGGGAGSAGTNQSGPTGGPGGNGLANLITGSSVTRAGGGGGGFWNGVNGPGGAGGPGGGGSAISPYTAGTVNTGGGGAGSPVGNLGGSGIVIIRYKFQ